MSFGKILITVDDGPIAAHAADLGIDLAKSLGAELAFIHVIDPSLGYAPEGGVAAAELIAIAKRDGKRLVDSFRDRALPLSVLEFVPVGKPAGSFIEAAREWSADLILVGSHGRSGVPRAFIGSVAEAPANRYE
jgi:nucleotide-binding universal stress UspA family protein